MLKQTTVRLKTGQTIMLNDHCDAWMSRLVYPDMDILHIQEASKIIPNPSYEIKLSRLKEFRIDTADASMKLRNMDGELIEERHIRTVTLSDERPGRLRIDYNNSSPVPVSCKTYDLSQFETWRLFTQA